MKQFVLYGFGGHGRVVKDAIVKLGGEIVHIFDENNIYNSSIFPDAELIIAIGNNEIRKIIACQVSHKLGTLIHPNAILGQDVIIEKGSVIFANAVIQSGSRIGKNCIINANVTIDHDVILEDNVSVYPGAYIGGGAKISECKTVEPNAVVTRNTIF